MNYPGIIFQTSRGRTKSQQFATQTARATFIRLGFSYGYITSIQTLTMGPAV